MLNPYKTLLNKGALNSQQLLDRLTMSAEFYLKEHPWGYNLWDSHRSQHFAMELLRLTQEFDNKNTSADFILSEVSRMINNLWHQNGELVGLVKASLFGHIVSDNIELSKNFNLLQSLYYPNSKSYAPVCAVSDSYMYHIGG